MTASALVPPPSSGDHVRGPDGAPLLVLYAEFGCPHCAQTFMRLRDAGEHRVIFRHFALKGRQRRAPALGAAAEAAGLQGAFWPMADALFADQGRQDDPHLWERARTLGLDVARFDADRRGEWATGRVASDTRVAIRAGVIDIPALYPHREA